MHRSPTSIAVLALALLLPAVSASADCPPGSVNPAPVKKIVLHGVDFDGNGANIRPGGVAVVDEAIQVLAGTDAKIVVVEASAARVRNEPFRQKVERRAHTVQEYLVNHGVAADGVAIEASGEPASMACDALTDARGQNPRVELRLD